MIGQKAHSSTTSVESSTVSGAKKTYSTTGSQNITLRVDEDCTIVINREKTALKVLIEAKRPKDPELAREAFSNVYT